MATRFDSLTEFYLYYLSEHQHPTCRNLHYGGSIGVILLLVGLTLSGEWQWIWCALIIGYGCAWIGHFKFEHNKPATFQYPLYSFVCDWIMLKDWMTGQLAPKLAAAQQRYGTAAKATAGSTTVTADQ